MADTKKVDMKKMAEEAKKATESVKVLLLTSEV